jgi:hypothetical protein
MVIIKVVEALCWWRCLDGGRRGRHELYRRLREEIRDESRGGTKILF